MVCAALLTTACGGSSGGKQPELKTLEGDYSGDVSLSPWPSVVGNNTVSFDLVDANGAALEGAVVDISPWMPAHGHGSTDVSAEETEPGHYVSRELHFNMPGQWELRVHVQDGDHEGRLSVSLEVP